jgi:hypothetical protein
LADLRQPPVVSELASSVTRVDSNAVDSGLDEPVASDVVDSDDAVPSVPGLRLIDVEALLSSRWNVSHMLWSGQVAEASTVIVTSPEELDICSKGMEHAFEFESIRNPSSVQTCSPLQMLASPT